MDTTQNLVHYGKLLMDKEYVAGPGGNISIRSGECAYMSPSGFALDAVSPEHFVQVNIATGEAEESEYRPTSEVSFHLAIYRRRPDVNAVVHTHPPYATGLGSSGVKLAPLTPDYVAYLDHVEHIDYIVPTGDDLAQAIADALSECNCLVMGNHGVLTVGSNLKEAYYRTDILEQSAKMQFVAITAGRPRILTDEEVDEVRALRAEAYRRRLLSEGKA